MQTFDLPLKTWECDDWIGLLVGMAILSLWFVTLGSLFIISASPIFCFNYHLYLITVIAIVILRTYLQTGLFIVAHDSMHGNLIPSDRKLNDLIGRIAVTVYSFLPYDRCCLNHANHHRYPSQNGDPDFHGSNDHPLFWYCKFIREYFPERSLWTFAINLILISSLLTLALKIQFINLILFLLLPLVLSSLQLFFFGTYLPHRQIENNPHFAPRLQSDRYDLLWALLSCYNFGHYHWEHHEYPETPWYRLPYIHLRES